MVGGGGGGGVTFVGGSFGLNISSLTLPAGTQSGDCLLLFGFLVSDNAWKIDDGETGFTQIFALGGGTEGRIIGQYQFISGTPPSSITGLANYSDVGYSLTAWRGVSSSPAPGGSVSGSTVDPPSVTTTTGNAAVVCMALSQFVYAPPVSTSGYTYIHGTSGSGYVSPGVGVAYLLAETAGTYNPGSFGGDYGGGSYTQAAATVKLEAA